MHKKTKAAASIEKSNTPLNHLFSSLWKRIKNLMYDFSVYLHKKLGLKRKTTSLTKKERNRLIFYVTILSVPVLQFIVLYIIVNANSIFLAFQKMDYYGGGYEFVGFNNFADVFRDLRTQPVLQYSLRNSLILFAIGCGVGMTLSLMFSYYIYKKFLFSNIFKVFLFMPQIIPSIALVVMYKFFAEEAIPDLYELINKEYMHGLIYYEGTQFPTVLFYTIWASFGTQVLMYSGAMGGISVSVVEAAKLDGCKPLREFRSIILPLIYPTFVTFVVVGIAGVFTNQMHLLSFFGGDSNVSSKVYTFGFYLYQRIISPLTTLSDYPYLATLGILLTLVSAPITLFAKWLLEKIGPSVD